MIKLFPLRNEGFQWDHSQSIYYTFFTIILLSVLFLLFKMTKEEPWVKPRVAGGQWGELIGGKEVKDKSWEPRSISPRSESAMHAPHPPLLRPSAYHQRADCSKTITHINQSAGRKNPTSWKHPWERRGVLKSMEAKADWGWEKGSIGGGRVDLRMYMAGGNPEKAQD